MSPKRLLALKILITFSLIFIIFYQIDWVEFKRVFFQINPLFLVVFIIIILLNVILSSFKWQLLISIHRFNPKLPKLISFYFTSMFLSNFLPGNIGGDSYRFIKILKLSGSRSAAFFPIFVERVTGIATLLFIGFLGGMISFLREPDALNRNGLIIGSIGAVFSVILILFLFSEKPVKIFLNMRNMPKILINILKNFIGYSGKWRKLLICILASFVFYCLLLFGRWILLRAVGASCSLDNLALVVMLSTIVATLPISLNGFGIMDASFIFLISNYGVSYNSAVMVMFVYRILSLFVSLSGVFFYYTEQKFQRSLNAAC